MFYKKPFRVFLSSSRDENLNGFVNTKTLKGFQVKYLNDLFFHDVYSPNGFFILFVFCYKMYISGVWVEFKVLYTSQIKQV